MVFLLAVSFVSEFTLAKDKIIYITFPEDKWVFKEIISVWFH